jgi:hypothetical protein
LLVRHAWRETIKGVISWSIMLLIRIGREARPAMSKNITARRKEQGVTEKPYENKWLRDGICFAFRIVKSSYKLNPLQMKGDRK